MCSRRTREWDFFVPPFLEVWYNGSRSAEKARSNFFVNQRKTGAYRMMETSNSRFVVFVSLTGDQQIKLYNLDLDSGALQLQATSDAHGPSGALCLHPSGKVMLVAHVGSTTLASFRLDVSSGELTLINKMDTGIGIPAHLITDRAGRFLLTAYYGGGGVTVHRLGDDGAIEELVQYIDTGEKAHSILSAAADRFVFVPHVCPTNKTCQFRFDSESGLLTPNAPAELPPPDDETGPRHICFRPQGDVAYIVNEQGNTVTAHHFDAENGTLASFQNISTLPSEYTDGGATAHVEVHPNGKWAYASNRGHDSIVGFNIDTGGALSPFGHFSVPASPRSFNIDATGTYLYCAGEAADIMTCYRVDSATGQLHALADYAVGKQPFWVMVTTLG
ncbi:MAG: beta-propeller fold lactonase family protein [Candidatus Poribacteria bacterium]|nr:beta-propeller fold lactonase family protein [Candidatus Poribacteria bacterium]